MSLLLSEEQLMLRDSAQTFLAERSPVAALRALRNQRTGNAPSGHDAALWREISELGWPAAVLPEAEGGLDVGYAGLAAVFESIGRHLAAAPLLSSVVLGGTLLQTLGNSTQRSQHLPRVASGEATFALALEERPRHAPNHISTSAQLDGGQWVLEGDKHFVMDAPQAEHLIIIARTAGSATDSEGLTAFLVPAPSAGLRIEAAAMVDSRSAARVSMRGLRLGLDACLGTPGQAFASLEIALDRARLCVSSELLGIITEAFERTVAYLKERVQFGVAIGSFQALQHRAARLYVEIELLRSAVAAAAEAVDASSPRCAEVCSLAKARASDLSEHALNEAVQLHGGIGVTDEYDLGLFLKRARVLQQAFGDGVFHRDRYARLRGF